MKLHKIKIGGEDHKVAVADNPELRQKGLSSVSQLGPGKGMLFIFPEVTKINMVMRDMSFDLDFIFIDRDWSILQLGSLTADSEESITANKPCYMVLEVISGTIEKLGLKVGDGLEPGKTLSTQFKGVSKFKHGGKFEMVGDKVFEVKEDDIKIDPNKMQILNENGEVAANIDNGARVFSREHTEEMIKKHKDGDKIGLADSYIAIIDIQNNQKQEHVTKD